MNGTPKSETKEADERKRPPKKVFVVRVLRALKRRYHAGKNAAQTNKQTNQILARWTRNVGLFTFGLIIVGLITAAIFKWQLDVMRGQLDEMQAARRPWIDVQTTIAGPLTFDPSPGLELKIVANNLGLSPALEVWVNVSMFLYGVGADTVKEIPERCADLRKQELTRRAIPRAPGYLLFPNHTQEITSRATLKELRNKGLFPMHILICADYRFTYSPEIHSTDILYTLTTDLRMPDAAAIMTPGNCPTSDSTRLSMRTMAGAASSPAIPIKNLRRGRIILKPS